MPQAYKLIGKDCLEAVGYILHTTIAINHQSNHYTMLQTKNSTISSIVIGILNMYKKATKSVANNRK